MKSILVPVGQQDCRSSLMLAAEVAKHLGSLIEGIPLREPPVPSVDWGMGSAFVIEEPAPDDDHVEAEARTQFLAAMAAGGVSVSAGPPPAGGAAAIWNEAKPIGNHGLGRLARAFSLTCIPHPARRPNAMATFEAALFESGGPIMMAPNDCPIRIGGCYALAWNGSDETARTLTFAMPLLRQAARLVILADESGQFASPSGGQIRRKLALEGIEADLRLLPEGSVMSGKTILEAAEAEGCDILIKGAYTQSRLRQIIFGGATQHILGNARMPLFMAH
ncbi:MAG: universal stress protein [Rhodobacteraceae bacterium]|nr:universal stress protein [Paracoccaceae bacterium]